MRKNAYVNVSNMRKSEREFFLEFSQCIFCKEVWRSIVHDRPLLFLVVAVRFRTFTHVSSTLRKPDEKLLLMRSTPPTLRGRRRLADVARHEMRQVRLGFESLRMYPPMVRQGQSLDAADFRDERVEQLYL